MSIHPEEQLSAYMDNELTDSEKKSVDEHLASCSSCRMLLADLLDMRQQVESAFRAIETPEDFGMRVEAALDAEAVRNRLPIGWFAPLLLAAAVVLAVFWFAAGAAAVKLIGGLFKLTTAAVYLLSHYIGTIPLLAGAAVTLAIAIMAVSGLSLRRLLQASAG